MIPCSRSMRGPSSAKPYHFETKNGTLALSSNIRFLSMEQTTEGTVLTIDLSGAHPYGPGGSYIVVHTVTQSIESIETMLIERREAFEEEIKELVKNRREKIQGRRQHAMRHMQRRPRPHIHDDLGEVQLDEDDLEELLENAMIPGPGYFGGPSSGW